MCYHGVGTLGGKGGGSAALRAYLWPFGWMEEFMRLFVLNKAVGLVAIC